MKSEKTHEPVSNSGLIELSKLRESVVVESRGHDTSLLTEHVPSLRADKPQRKRIAATSAAMAASILLAMSTVAYALHHQVTQHSVSEVSAAPASKPAVAPMPPGERTFAEPLMITEADVSEPLPVVEETVASVAAVATRRRASRSVSMASTPVHEATSGDRSIDELLHAATGGQVPPRAGTSRPAESALPMRPARTHVSTAFRSVSQAVQQCAPSDEGIVSARVVVNGPTGRVRSASLNGVELSSQATRCMEGALRGVRLDPFQQERLEITFPYRL